MLNAVLQSKILCTAVRHCGIVAAYVAGYNDCMKMRLLQQYLAPDQKLFASHASWVVHILQSTKDVFDILSLTG